VGEGVGFFEIVGGEEHGFALGGEGSDLCPEAAAGFDIEADGGLVEEDQVGIAGEGDAEEGALFLASGELAEQAVFDAFKARGFDDLRVRHRVRIVAAEDCEVLADAEHFGGAADLQHGSGADARGGVARVGAEDADAAGGGRGEAEHQLDGGGFSGAVGAEQGDDFAAP
jgi:hypothetical protein